LHGWHLERPHRADQRVQIVPDADRRGAAGRGKWTDPFASGENSEELIAFYLQSIGNGGRSQGLLGGTQGIGLHDSMIDAYLLISQVYQRGDKIWLFGFSRGAWAARSLGAFIARSGLIPAADADDDSAADQAEKIWLNYKEDRGKKRGGRFWRHHDETPIRMIGVWDTVGELGVPVFNGLRLVDRDELRFLKFSDCELSPRVEHARQALAIDEERADFVPTLWDEREGIKQVWFPGAHADVGGGYENRGLSDIALEWMMQEVNKLDADLWLSTQPTQPGTDPRLPAGPARRNPWTGLANTAEQGTQDPRSCRTSSECSATLAGAGRLSTQGAGRSSSMHRFLPEG
jgi:uncharacterized protein (DUF2235 family)